MVSFTCSCLRRNVNKTVILSQIIEILIEVAIQDPIARSFWRTYFYNTKKGLQEEVSWSEFVNKLSQSADIDITRDTQHKLCGLIAAPSANAPTGILFIIHQ